MKGRMHRSKRDVSRFVVLGLLLIVPTQIGCCPEFRNGAINAIDSATTSVVLGGTEPQDAIDAAFNGIVDAALEMFFDFFRTDEVS